MVLISEPIDLANNLVLTPKVEADPDDSSAETAALFKADGGVELYYDNGKKAETSADGLSVTGMLSSTGNIQIAILRLMRSYANTFIS